MANQKTAKKNTNQRPIENRGDRLLELTKILRNIRAEKEIINKNQLSATKSDGTRYIFLEMIFKRKLDLDYQEKKILAEIERLKNES